MAIHDLSRRNFLQGAVLAGASFAGAGALTACSQAESAVDEGLATTGDDHVWEAEADLVILGSGCAGMYGAYHAADAGLSVILLEKQPEETAGGDTRCMGGYMNRKNMTMDLLMNSYSFGDCDEEWAEKIVEGSLDTVDFLLEHGCEWETVEDGFLKGNGPAVYECLRDAMLTKNVDVRYETPATELIQNNAGEVIGVVASSNGQPVNFKAKRAVLIATGAYTCNKQLMWDLNLPGIETYSISSPYLTGDGLLMAANLGARIGKVSKGVEFDAFVSKVASEAIGTGIEMLKPPVPSLIYVNGDAKRFQDEYLNMQHSKTTLPCTYFTGSMAEYRQSAAHYDNAIMWEVFDQAAFDSGSVGNTTSNMTWANVIPSDGYIWSEDNKAELENGWILQADTLEELAGKMGVDPAALVETVASYNAGCEAGEDAFGRNPEMLVALGEGPYYAVQLGISVLYTIGGLMTDANGRTVDWTNNPIPRLYSAGNVGTVGSYLAAIAARGNMTQALMAVEDIQTLDAWDEA